MRAVAIALLLGQIGVLQAVCPPSSGHICKSHLSAEIQREACNRKTPAIAHAILCDCYDEQTATELRLPAMLAPAAVLPVQSAVTLSYLQESVQIWNSHSFQYDPLPS